MTQHGQGVSGEPTEEMVERAAKALFAKGYATTSTLRGSGAMNTGLTSARAFGMPTSRNLAVSSLRRSEAHMRDHLLFGSSVSRVRAESWNLLGRAAWMLGRVLEAFAPQFYGLSGRFDANADQAGYWTWHSAKGDS